MSTLLPTYSYLLTVLENSVQAFVKEVQVALDTTSDYSSCIDKRRILASSIELVNCTLSSDKYDAITTEEINFLQSVCCICGTEEHFKSFDQLVEFYGVETVVYELAIRLRRFDFIRKCITYTIDEGRTRTPVAQLGDAVVCKLYIKCMLEMVFDDLRDCASASGNKKVIEYLDTHVANVYDAL